MPSWRLRWPPRSPRMAPKTFSRHPLLASGLLRPPFDGQGLISSSFSTSPYLKIDAPVETGARFSKKQCFRYGARFSDQKWTQKLTQSTPILAQSVQRAPRELSERSPEGPWELSGALLEVFKRPHELHRPLNTPPGAPQIPSRALRAIF